MRSQKSVTIIYWISTITIVLAFFITGVGNLVPFDHIAGDMRHLGYPPYFLKILGGWKIIGAIIIASPLSNRFKHLAYTGMMLDLTGAALSRLAVGDDIVMVIIPLIVLGIVITSWAQIPLKRQN